MSNSPRHACPFCFTGDIQQDWNRWTVKTLLGTKDTTQFICEHIQGLKTTTANNLGMVNIYREKMQRPSCHKNSMPCCIHLTSSRRQPLTSERMKWQQMSRHENPNDLNVNAPNRRTSTLVVVSQSSDHVSINTKNDWYPLLDLACYTVIFVI